jgi:hypothetical protein
MAKISLESVLSAPAYSQHRAKIREQVLAHKKRRTLQLGEHLCVLFEDETTLRYQIQEMLRIERVEDPAGIQQELDAYNPLVPDGDNWKATLFIQFPDVEERRRALVRLKGIEHCMWLEVAGYHRLYAIADEDLLRENDQKTSAVHFLRYQLNASLIQSIQRGAAFVFGCDHPDYTVTPAIIPETLRAALCADLQG